MENRLPVARGHRVGGWVKRGGIKKYKQPRDVKHSTGNLVSNVVVTVWCQVGAGKSRGTFCKVRDCLNTVLYA